MRTQPIPHAYRAFFRQIGLDPDASRIPSEEAAVARLLQGGFRSRDLLADALLIALVETGVPVWALDADLVDAGGLGIRTTVTGERFGSVESPLPEGRLVVADAHRAHALLFGPMAPGHAVNGPHPPDHAVRRRRRRRSRDPPRGGAVDLRRGPHRACSGSWNRVARVVSLAPVKGGCDGAPRAGDEGGAGNASGPELRRRGAGGAGRSAFAAHPDREAGARARRRVRHRLPDGWARLGLGGGPSRSAAARPRRARARPRRPRRAPPRRPRDDRERADQQAANRLLLERMLLEPGKHRFARIACQRPRRAWLRRLAGQAPARADRHADGLVAGQALLGLSVTRGPRDSAPRPG